MYFLQKNAYLCMSKTLKGQAILFTKLKQYKMSTNRIKWHCSYNIAGLLRQVDAGEKLIFFEDDNGNPISHLEAKSIVLNLKAQGHKLLPVGDCEGFDPFGKGCPGHEQKEAL